MAMQVGGSDEGGGGEMVDINTTPLIDVMLVLLIMFIITIPIQTHAVKLDLPSNNNPPNNIKPDFNTIEVDFLGQILWNKQPVTLQQLSADLKAAAAKNPEPETRLRPDPQAKYAVVDQVMATAQSAGVTKLGFVGNEQYQNQ